MKILHKKEYNERKGYLNGAEYKKLKKNRFDKFNINKLLNEKSKSSFY